MKRMNRYCGQRGGRISRRAAVVCAALGLALCAVGRADTIYVSGGKAHTEVEIKDAKWDAVSYVLTGAAAAKTKRPQSIEGFTVTALDRVSQRLGPARGALENGDFAKAEEALAAVTAGEDWEKAEAAYLRGRLYLESAGGDRAKAEKAVAAFTAYLEAYRAGKDFYVPFAVYGLGKALIAAGKPQEATAQFKALEEFGGARGIWAVRAKIGEGWAVLKEKGRTGVNVARRIFTEVLADRTLSVETQQEAAVGRTATLTVGEQYDDAIAFLNQSFFEVKAVAYSEYYGEACNLMGDAYRGKRNPQEAELWYLRATCFFKRYPGVYRNAAKNLADIYKAMGRNDRAKEWEQRAGD
ncbi:MAG TPA: hypothetical protein PKX48_15545 [Planctomycetota bacterium]|jgi:tetratricopeptide (TPR) repeat protein|nr:hypothetical protein [Planctomycetota bacterium]OQC19086.1 MAG: hypothetical protein BWX69_03007 [Planctomycetes bacterium ADurb.Bin069]NMD36929.1 hypothetical protein [Planctomycetota bacterium]HNS00525.1 hypothetical protein [Planctomycetota bacterium]HNU27235.1 hypothetical protein [Planctomycetota bacterium]